MCGIGGGKRVVAYFPTIYVRHDRERSRHLALSHGEGSLEISPWYARMCRPATRREAAGIHAELTSIGYRLKPERIRYRKVFD